MISAKNSSNRAEAPTLVAHQDSRELCQDSGGWGYLYEEATGKPRQGQCRKLSWKCRALGTLNSLSYYIYMCTCGHTSLPFPESIPGVQQRSTSRPPFNALSCPEYSLNIIFKVRKLRLRTVRSLIVFLIKRWHWDLNPDWLTPEPEVQASKNAQCFVQASKNAQCFPTFQESALP